MATLCLINFPEFSESKEFLKIGRSEVCVWGGVLKVGLLNCPSLYIGISCTKKDGIEINTQDNSSKYVIKCPFIVTAKDLISYALQHSGSSLNNCNLEG